MSELDMLRQLIDALERSKGTEKTKQRLTLDSTATIYGCCGLFDLCNDVDLMSLSLEGQSPFLDWLGWVPSLDCNIRKSFITYVRPEQADGVCTPGYLADPCAEPYKAEWGKCEFLLHEWARLRRQGPVRDVTRNAVRLCNAQPRYRLDGRQITDDREYDMRIATEVLLQDLKRMVITGNAATPGQFDGFNQLVKRGYTDPTGQRCKTMDSHIINWNSNPLSGGAGITWNGRPVGATYDFIDVLLAVFRHIRQNIGYAPALDSQRLSVGDIVLVMPTFMTTCLLDMFTCWRVCPSNSDMTATLNTLEGRRYRDGLNGGMFGAGRIFLDSFEIPLIAYDWGLIQGPTRADVYLLTGQVGGVKTIQGQYLDMRPSVGAYPGQVLAYTDGGRILTGTEVDYTCVQQWVEMGPRILSWAPWANARFEDVVCAGPGLPKSPDPCETSFFPESYFVEASCPPNGGQ
jgi:hypothetical protein